MQMPPCGDGRRENPRYPASEHVTLLTRKVCQVGYQSQPGGSRFGLVGVGDLEVELLAILEKDCISVQVPDS